MSRQKVLPLLLLLGAGVSANAAEPDAAPAVKPVVYLKQGWSAEERQRFYFTTQGSQLIPYDWFLALEKAGSKERFASAGNMERFRFIPQHRNNDRNPDGLPIGFVKDDNPDTVKDALIKRSFFGSDFNARNGAILTNAWLGLTCAACHTAQIEHEKLAIRIDGAPALADVQSFLAELSDAVRATHDKADVLERFARLVLKDTGYNAIERDALCERLKAFSPVLDRLVRRGTGKHPYGFGRLDAFGAILNEVCETSLELPANYHPADAPASFPFLWETPQLDWVQWNGTADNPLARNVGEVIGVFGQMNLRPTPPEEQFKSTVHLRNLVQLEDQVDGLKAPVWPVEIFGKLDEKLVAKGKQLFGQNCAACHALRDPMTKDFPRTAPNAFGKQFIKTTMVDLKHIGTDPALAMNFATRKVEPGFSMPPGTPPVPRPAVLSIAVGGAIKSKIAEQRPMLDQATIIRINGFRQPDSKPPNPLAYKARPLEGIWATAPFLHNGSVPNLYELLLPSKVRSKSFFVGSRQFDKKYVGYSTAKIPGSWEFKIADANGPIPGNQNAGHEGHGPGEKLGFTETFENGKWREFTEEERWALVEYMKSLGQPEGGQPTAAIEEIPPQEAEQIQNVVALTFQQLKNRYPGGKQVLRGVHAKDHGCVKAQFQIAQELDRKYRVGVFSEPGRRYDAWVRFSNAATLVLPDDPKDEMGNRAPGSRGMAIKLLGVAGMPLVPPHGAFTQDFLMVNHPVFAFANVEDYEVLSSVVADPANKESAAKFFAIQFAKGGAAAARAKRTLEIVNRIRAANVAAGAFQPQPASPVDCRYFSGAPFLFGDGSVMKFSAVPVDAPAEPQPNVADPNYLRNALIERLAVREGSKPVVFKFQVQRRDVSSLNIAEDIENVCNEWPEAKFEFVTVATLTIPPQEFDAPERRAECENLFFTPWHGVAEHRPLGGINRMRRAVYEASSGFRHQPKEPAGP
jgi:hypothetical protein